MSQSTKTLLAQIAAQDVRLNAMDMQQRVLLQWVTELCAQLTEAGLRPVTELEVRRRMGLPAGPYVGHANGPVDMTTDDVALRELLATRFNSDELASLAQDIDADEDAVAGRTMQERARSLVGWARRRGALRRLVTAVERVRPGTTADVDGL